MLKLNRALVLRHLGDETGARNILRDIADDPNATATASAWAKVMLTKPT
jgi:hypothetical protein